MQWAEEAVRRKRAVVPLPEGQSIGLELDFCTEVRKSTPFHSVGDLNVLHQKYFGTGEPVTR